MGKTREARKVAAPPGSKGRQSTRDPLVEALDYFEERRKELSRRYPGKFGLFYGRRMIGVYDTWDEGLDEGYRRFGRRGFLLRELTPSSPPIVLPFLIEPEP